MKVDSPIQTDNLDKEIIKILYLFLENMHLLTPAQRGIIIKLLEFSILPRYQILEEKVPIEEEYLKKH